MAIPTSGLVVKYTMDDVVGLTLNSESGAYPATITDAAQVSGKLGYALSFNGSTSNVGLDLSSFNSTAGAIVAWVNGTGMFFSSTNSGNTDFVFYVSILSDTGKVKVRIKGATTGVDVQFETDDTVNLSDWNHIVIQSDGAAYSVYINGVSSTLTFDKGSNTGHWSYEVKTRDNCFLGAINLAGTNYYFTGKVDQLRLYSLANSYADVQALFTETNDIYMVSGIVSVDGAAYSGELRIYNEATGDLIGITTSDANGNYSMITQGDEALYVMVIPPSGYRPLVHGPIIPTLSTP